MSNQNSYNGNMKKNPPQQHQGDRQKQYPGQASNQPKNPQNPQNPQGGQRR